MDLNYSQHHVYISRSVVLLHIVPALKSKAGIWATLRPVWEFKLHDALGSMMI